MSYEGYEQNICENGHYFMKEASYVMQEDEDNVCYCGAKSVWINAVDDTNCESYGYIPMILLEDRPGHHRVPSKEETKELQTWTPYDKGQKQFIVSGKVLEDTSYWKACDPIQYEVKTSDETEFIICSSGEHICDEQVAYNT